MKMGSQQQEYGQIWYQQLEMIFAKYEISNGYSTRKDKTES